MILIVFNYQGDPTNIRRLVIRVAHTFIMEPGRWALEGHWLERNKDPIPLKGRTVISWSNDNWFNMVTKLVFPNSSKEPVLLDYRCRLDDNEQVFSFVLQHSLLGKVEGEGWLGPQAIIQRYWVLGDTQKRSGFDSAFKINDHTYSLSSGLLSGHYLNSSVEARLERPIADQNNM